MSAVVGGRSTLGDVGSSSNGAMVPARDRIDPFGERRLTEKEVSEVAADWSLLVGPLSEYCWKYGIGSVKTRPHAVWNDVSSSRPLVEGKWCGNFSIIQLTGNIMFSHYSVYLFQILICI